MVFALTLPQEPHLNPENLLRRIIQRIRRSLDLQEILNATAAEIQQFLEIDRIKIYRFHPDHSSNSKFGMYQEILTNLQ
ncbi:MAG: hypothetical protein MUF49_15920 [Oculatellaceae cyanobacterium Prado106]|jgi:GAF domain-containing protein|nr:hypothetical protein [Oculatellaceae cyanobacterium Prado106]